MMQILYTETVLEMIERVNPLSPALRSTLRAALQMETFIRGHRLVKQGSICNKMYFLVKGIVQCYYGERENPCQTYFMSAGQMIFSEESFYCRKEGVLTISAIEDTITMTLSSEELEKICAEFPEFNCHIRKLTEIHHIKSNIQSVILRKRSAIERYRLFTELEPEQAQKIPAKYIASLLAIREETLSRIKSGPKTSKGTQDQLQDINMQQNQTEQLL